MKRKNKRRKEPQAQPLVQGRKVFDITMPTSQMLTTLFRINLADGSIVMTERRKPRGRPRRKATRDAQIVNMKDVQRYTFGQIARKLNIGREVAEAAYYRTKPKHRQGETKFR